MRMEERHSEIVKMILKKGEVKIDDLTRTFGVSVPTIRRDLGILKKQGLVDTTYGGATSARSRFGRTLEASQESRAATNRLLKIGIAEKVRDLIDDNDSLIIDTGTTTAEVARFLRNKKNLTVVTNSVHAAINILSGNDSEVSLYFLGGHMRSSEMATSGVLCDRMLQNFSVDKAIIGAAGLTEGGVITDFHLEESEVRRKMLETARVRILALDSSKFRVEAFVRVCDLSMIDVLVTDGGAPKDLLQKFAEKGIEIVVADSPGGGSEE